MQIPLLSRLDRLIGIDLGSNRIRVWAKDKEIVYNEAPCISVSRNNGQVLAIGNEAAQMQGRVGNDVEVHWIIKQGELTEVKLTQAYFKLLFKKLFGEFILIKPVVMISVPTSLPKTKKDVFAEIFYELGVGEVYTISQSLAAAIGAGVPVADASGCFILQMGRGIVESSVISMGRVVITDFSLRASNFLSDRIAWEVKKHSLVELPRNEVRKLKQNLHIGLEEDKHFTVTGHDLKKKAPKEFSVSNSFLTPIAQDVVANYISLLNTVMSKIPPELTTDVIDKGLLISGDYAQMKGVEDYLIQELKIPVSSVDDPEFSVIKGIGLVLENIQLYKESLGYAT